MNYEQKLARAERMLLDHYGALAEVQGLALLEGEVSGFIRNLKAAGGTSNEALMTCSWEDLEKLKIPALLAKAMVKMFREDGIRNEQTSGYVSDKKAVRMSYKELLEHYNPAEPDNAVGKRLAEVSKGLRFIVFSDQEGVMVEPSAQLLAEIREGHGERELFTVSERPRKTYRVGERPGNLVDENPLYPKRALRPNGDCDQTNRSWEGVDRKIRTLLYIAVTETGELRITGVDQAHNAMDLVVGKTTEEAEKVLRSRYPRASVSYDERTQVGYLPTLKLERVTAGGNRRNDPFAVAGGGRTW